MKAIVSVRASWLALVAALSQACTIHHSRQALYEPNYAPPSPSAVFVSEEDAGLSILGAFVLSEPDHYAVLMDRARRHHNCARLSHPQLDFYTDHWLIVGFPIARLTLVCQRSPDTSTAVER